MYVCECCGCSEDNVPLYVTIETYFHPHHFFLVPVCRAARLYGSHPNPAKS